MAKNRLFCGWVVLGLMPLLSLSAHPSPSEAWVPLFNGEDLAGFETWLVDSKREDPRRVFSVLDGMIRISGEGLGYLATRQVYQNYHLMIEYKWGEKNWSWGDRVGKARDSGIFLHAIGPNGNSVDGKGAWMAAIECNVFEGAVGDFLLIRGTDESEKPIVPSLTTPLSRRRDKDGFGWWDPQGENKSLTNWGRVNWLKKSSDWKDVYGFRGANDLEKPGEWNVIECLCLNDTITLKLNGEIVNRARNVYPNRGKILLQCEGSEIYFRNFKLRNLTP